MIEVLFLALLVVVGAVSGMVMVVAARIRKDGRWLVAAERLGARFVPDSPWRWRRTLRIVAPPEAPPLLLERGSRGDDPKVTRLVLDAPGLSGARLLLVRENDRAALARAAGLVRFATGDALFDEHFVAFADAPARARLWLGLEERRALRVLYGFRLLVEGAQVILEHDEELPGLAQVQAAHAAARRLAGAEARFCERWSDVAPFVDAKRASHDPPRLETVRGGIVVSIAPCLDGEAAFVRVRAELLRPGAPEVQVPGAEPDREALEAAVREVAARAQALAAEGPYR
jgi:hypothetical protein